MYKVIDFLMDGNPLVSLNDQDKTLIKPKFENPCVATMYNLGREARYCGRYRGIFPETINILSDTKSNEEQKVRNITTLLRDFQVLDTHFYDAILLTERQTKLEKPIKEYLKILGSLPKLEFYVFTGSERNLTKIFFDRKIAPFMPHAKTAIYATEIEAGGDRRYTGYTKEIWNPEKRAEETRKLVHNKISIGAGDRFNDMPMLEEVTRGFFLAEGITGYKAGEVQNDVHFIKKKDLPKELKKFLKTDLSELSLTVTDINTITPLMRRV